MLMCLIMGYCPSTHMLYNIQYVPYYLYKVSKILKSRAQWVPRFQIRIYGPIEQLSNHLRKYNIANTIKALFLYPSELLPPPSPLLMCC